MDCSRLRRIALAALAIPALLLLAPLAATAQGYLAVHSFELPLGAKPIAPFLQNPADGFLYGTTSADAVNGAGSVQDQRRREQLRRPARLQHDGR